MKTVTTLDVALFNIRATPPMRRKSIIHDLGIAKDTEADVIVWNELAKLRWYRSILKDVLPERQDYRHLFLEHRNAVTIDTDMVKVLKATPHMLTKRQLWIPQPARYSNKVTIEDRASLEEEDIFAVHLTNGGYNGRWRPRRNREARKRLWDEQFAELRTQVRHSADTRFAIVAGDMNRVDMPKIHPRQRLVVQEGIMKMYVVPPPHCDVHVIQKRVIPTSKLRTDHAGLFARIELVRYGR